MNDLINSSYAKSEQKMTSLEIAELTGKQHKNVMRDCKELNKVYVKISQLKIEPSSYINSQNKQQPMFLLTKKQTQTLILGYSIEMRIKVMDRLEELENKNQIQQLPKNFSEALRMLADTSDREEQALIQLQETTDKIEEDKPKVVFAESVLGCDNSVLVRQFAKDLCDENFKIGQNKLFDWFRENNYLNTQNEPYQSSINQGLFEVVTRMIGTATSNIQVKTTKVTGKGQVYFSNKIKK